MLRKLLLVSYSPLWGCAGDRVEMVVKVHCGNVLADEFAAMLKIRPQNNTTMHWTTISTWSLAAYSTAQKWVTSRVSFPVRRESRSARIIKAAISGINYWRHVQCLFNLVYRYYFIWWLHPTPKSRSFPKSHFLSFFCPLMATARNWNKSFMHIELCAGAVAIGRRGLVNQIPILTPDPSSWKAD